MQQGENHGIKGATSIADRRQIMVSLCKYLSEGPVIEDCWRSDVGWYSCRVQVKVKSLEELQRRQHL